MLRLTRPARGHSRERGQILVLFAFGAVALIAMVGLVLDGGDTYAQRRDEQNGADMAAMAGANAYMTVAEFQAYHSDRGNVGAVEASTEEIQAAIIRATDYIDTEWDFLGLRTFSPDQTLDWPRSGVFTEPELDMVDDQGVPELVKRACAELALAALSYDLDPNAPPIDGQLTTSTSQRAGDLAISTGFASELAQKGSPVWKRADKILAPYTAAPQLRRA